MPTYEVVDPKTGRVVAEMDGPSPPSPETVRKVLASLGAPTPEAPPDVSNLPGPPLQPSFGDVAGSALKGLPGAVSEFQNAQLNDLARTSIGTVDLIRRAGTDPAFRATMATAPVAGPPALIAALLRAGKPGPVVGEAMRSLDVPPDATAAQQAGKMVSTVAQFAAPGLGGVKAGPGAGLLARVGTEALSAGTVGALREGTPEAAGPAAVLGAAGPVVGKGLGLAGDVAKAVRSRAIETILRPVASSFKYGKDPVRGVLELDIAPTVTKAQLVSKVASRLGTLTADLEKAVKTGAPAVRADIRAETNAALDEFLKGGMVPEPVKKAATEFAEQVVQRTEDIAGTAAKVKLPVVLEIKRLVQQAAKYKGQDETGLALNDFRQSVAARLGRVIEGHVPEVAQTNRQLSDLIEAKRLLRKKGGRPSLLSIEGLRRASLDSAPVQTGLAGLSKAIQKATGKSAQEVAQILARLGAGTVAETAAAQ